MRASKFVLAVGITATVISAATFLAGYRQAGYTSLAVIVVVGLIAQFVAMEADVRMMRRNYRQPAGSEIPRTRRIVG